MASLIALIMLFLSTLLLKSWYLVTSTFTTRSGWPILVILTFLVLQHIIFPSPKILLRSSHPLLIFRIVLPIVGTCWTSSCVQTQMTVLPRSCLQLVTRITQLSLCSFHILLSQLHFSLFIVLFFSLERLTGMVFDIFLLMCPGSRRLIPMD